MTGNQNTGLLIQVACLIEVATKTGFTVDASFFSFSQNPSCIGAPCYGVDADIE